MSQPAISDEAVLKATGRSWREWFGVLEGSGLGGRTHEEMLVFLREDHGLPGWWQRAIAAEFERSIGRCVKGADPDDLHTLVARVLSFPAAVVHEAWTDEGRRAQWLRRGDFEMLDSTPPHGLTGLWKPDQSQLEIAIEPAEGGGCRLTVKHRDLPKAEFIRHHREFWERSIDRLVERLSAAA